MENKRHYACFSGAIRDGAKLRPQQAFNRFFDFSGKASCASGAALEALTGRHLTPDDVDTSEKLWALLSVIPEWKSFQYLNEETEPPCGCLTPAGTQDGKGGKNTNRTLQNLIVHLNNIHKWSRERIADWLYAEEEKLGFVTLLETESTESPQAAASQAVLYLERNYQ